MPNFEIKPLSLEDVSKINSFWPHTDRGNAKLVANMMVKNIHLGLYNENGELVAWCLRMDFGTLAVLQVDDNHLRKGYGSIIAKAISKKIAEECDIDITTNIVLSNFKSVNLFDKLGFHDIDNNHWIIVGQSNSIE